MIMLRSMLSDLGSCQRLRSQQTRAANWGFPRTRVSSATTTHIRWFSLIDYLW
ncbi:hypothetical protein lerEdw1_012334 [Lerista edwardsae]|nr:hypothetical protein lerEdw1_012334 [Lerista edwardsae]